jgi:hypothetical protein
MGQADAAIVGNKHKTQTALPCKATYALTEDSPQAVSANPPRVHQLTATVTVYCYNVINQDGLPYGTDFAGADLTLDGLGALASCSDSQTWYNPTAWFNGLVGQISCSTPYKSGGLIGRYDAQVDFWYGDPAADPSAIDAGCDERVSQAGWRTTCTKTLTTTVLPGTHD